jgi:hypothetical protein
MAQQLGFYAIQFRNQYLRPVSEVNPDHFEEIRAELGYTDLLLDDKPTKALTKAFTTSVHRDATTSAQRWHDVGSHFGSIYIEARGTSDRSQIRPHITNLRNIYKIHAHEDVKGW